jgi:hypothetical protein
MMANKATEERYTENHVKLNQRNHEFVSVPQERGALSFERRYHVTDPFIRRLGLEAELQVRDQVCTLDT